MFNTKDTMFDYIDGKEFLSSKELWLLNKIVL
jgi:hypothetical protein